MFRRIRCHVFEGRSLVCQDTQHGSLGGAFEGPGNFEPLSSIQSTYMRISVKPGSELEALNTERMI